jgi:1,4-dihydroxy-2-naphthoyl-CoA hydrolase
VDDPSLDGMTASDLPDDAATAIPASALAERLSIRIISASADRVVGRMPVSGNTQPMGLLHGGASAALAETLGSVAASLHGHPDRLPVGTDLTITHHRGVRDGEVEGVATPLHRGRTMTSHEIVVSDESGRRVATARLTCLLRQARPPE